MEKLTLPPAVVNSHSKTFDHKEFGQLRAVEINGRVGVVAKDVVLAIGARWNGITNIKHIPEEWRGVISVMTPFGPQQMHILFEEGFYFYLSRSDKPKALPFQKWLAGEVVPAIRKTGSYGQAQVTELPGCDFVKFWPSTRHFAKSAGRLHKNILPRARQIRDRLPQSLQKHFHDDTYIDPNNCYRPEIRLSPVAWHILEQNPRGQRGADLEALWMNEVIAVSQRLKLGRV